MRAPARLGEVATVRAAGRGAPDVSLSDGREVVTGYEGAAELVQAFEGGSARPLSLASADFDEDGTPDLAAGYAVGCDRIHVSGEGFFRSVEFQLKGAYVFRFYKAAFNRLPEYLEITADMSFVAGQTEAEVFQRRAQLATLITQRQEFVTLYGGMSNSQYVSALLGRYNLQQITTPDPASPDAGAKVTLTSTEMANRLTAGALTRAQSLRAVADSDEVTGREFDNAFVAVQYYGYLRRKPEPGGFGAWLRVLQSGDTRTMVNGFLNSAEYKLRFGQP